MKTLIKTGMLIFIIIITGCSSDDEAISTPQDESEKDYTSVQFEGNFSMDENGGARKVIIEFDQPAPSHGEIEIRLHLQEGLSIQTIPAAVDDIITLNVEKDDENASFSLFPADDNIIKGMKNLSITFRSMSDGFRKAHNNGLSITIIDDELKGKLRFMHEYGSREYFYREDGKISKTNYTSEWWFDKENFEYSNEGHIQKIISESGWSDRIFKWQEGKLISSEEFIENNKYAYSLYEYDEDGNISKKSDYQLNQSQTSFIPTSLFEFSYHVDGNLHKKLIYEYNIIQEEYEHLYTEIYDEYLDKLNLLPLNEIIPGISLHKNLPKSYRIENSEEVYHSFTYEYDSEGRVIKRILNEEIITFEYY